VGGENANIQEFPYLASLRYANTGVHFCGATIISSTKLLTAAHCFSTQHFREVRVYVGSSNSSDDTALHYQIFDLEVHPNFTGIMSRESKLHHDIAIITVF
jgi:trypsin